MPETEPKIDQGDPQLSARLETGEERDEDSVSQESISDSSPFPQEEDDTGDNEEDNARDTQKRETEKINKDANTPPLNPQHSEIPNPVSLDTGLLPAEKPPRSQQTRHQERSPSYFLPVIIMATLIGGVSGWIFLERKKPLPEAPTTRYAYPVPELNLLFPDETSPPEQKLDSGQENPASAPHTPLTEKTSPPSSSSSEETRETSLNSGKKETTARENVADSPTGTDSETEPSETEKKSPQASLANNLAFSPIQEPREILSETFLDKYRLNLGSQTAPDLLETTDNFRLPVMANGREAWREYARPFSDPPERPRIAIIIDKMGLNQKQSLAAIQTMPAGMSLAFSPYGRNLPQLAEQARIQGHEILLSIPMEAFNYPIDDPGPYGLISNLSPQQNRERLFWLMSRFPAYVGVIPSMGSFFMTSKEAMTPILEELKTRGLLFVDQRVTQRSVTGELLRRLNLPNVTVDMILDQQASRAAIDRQIEKAETLARLHGHVTILASPYPVSLERLALWSLELENKGFSLAPITAVTRLADSPQTLAKTP